MFFLAAMLLLLSITLAICLCARSRSIPSLTPSICIEHLAARNTPELILKNINFVGRNMRFVITDDFRLLALRNEYEALRGRIDGLANYLLSEHAQNDKERDILLQQLAVMYTYLETIELRCINQDYLIPNDIQE